MASDNWRDCLPAFRPSPADFLRAFHGIVDPEPWQIEAMQRLIDEKTAEEGCDGE